jgi:hypothetical protein
VQAEVAGTYIEKNLVENVEWETLIEGNPEGGGQTGIAGPLLVTGKLHNPIIG